MLSAAGLMARKSDCETNASLSLSFPRAAGQWIDWARFHSGSRAESEKYNASRGEI
jgi:hypothetical protein